LRLDGSGAFLVHFRKPLSDSGQGEKRTLPNPAVNWVLLTHADAEGLHFAIKMAAFEAEELRGVADIAARLLDFLEDVLALVGIARLLQ